MSDCLSGPRSKASTRPHCGGSQDLAADGAVLTPLGSPVRPSPTGDSHLVEAQPVEPSASGL